MVTQKMYDQGTRCRGICDFCKDGTKEECVQFKEKKATIEQPVGVEPKLIWKAKRVEQLRKAIKQYLDENASIPVEWIEEYNELIKEFKR